jgi:SAC3 family protein LENG8/THP3
LLISYRYKPDVSVRFLASELAFHGEDDGEEADSDAGPRQCLDFLCESGAEGFVERKDTDVRFLSGKAGQHFVDMRAAAFRKVDIKGQI